MPQISVEAATTAAADNEVQSLSTGFVQTRDADSGPFDLPSWQRMRRSTSFIFLLLLVLLPVADAFFFRHTIGWTAGAFAALLIGALLLRSSRFLAIRPGVIIAVAMLGLIIAMIDQPGPLEIILTITGLCTLSIINNRGWTACVPSWLGRWTEFLGRGLVQVPLDAWLTRRWLRKHNRRAPLALRIITNWIIPILLSLIFIGLFALANPIISRWMSQAGEQISRFFNELHRYIAPARILFWALMAWCIWGLLRTRTRGVFRAANSSNPPPSISAIGSTNAHNHESLIVRCLILFNLVFAVQTGLDLMYVAGGAELPEGMTYSTYARRGAYPLVATALLAAAFVLITFRPSAGSNRQEFSTEMRWARRLVYLWIAQNIALTLSAAWRLWLYVEVFSLTRLRVAAAIWMLLVVLGLVYIIWRIVEHRTNQWLLRINVVTAIVVLYICCFINIDGLIAWHNVKYCQEITGDPEMARFDPSYMRRLGPEALPALQWMISQFQSEPLSTDARAARGFADMVVRQLREDLDHQMVDWRGWTWRRARIAASMQTNDALLARSVNLQ